MIYDTTKKVVSSAVMLGTGNSVMNAIPGGGIMSPAMSKAGNMLGMAATAMYAKDAMHMMPDGTMMKNKDMKNKTVRY